MQKESSVYWLANPVFCELQPCLPCRKRLCLSGSEYILSGSDLSMRSALLRLAVKMGGFSLNRMHPDYLKLRVLITLFGGYFGSRLMSNIREEKGYTYGISAGVV